MKPAFICCVFFTLSLGCETGWRDSGVVIKQNSRRTYQQPSPHEAGLQVTMTDQRKKTFIIAVASFLFGGAILGPWLLTGQSRKLSSIRQSLSVQIA